MYTQNIMGKIKLLSPLLSLCLIILSVSVGSVYISPKEIIEVLQFKLFTLPTEVSNTNISIIWSLRLPRTVLAFICGGALSVTGIVMQSLLRNPLASSYTLGVSSGASFGACLVILYGFTLPFLPFFTLPLAGFICGLGTIFLVITFSGKIDKRMDNNTIILTGIVFSLFINAIVTLLSALAREEIDRLIFWQMGSFATKGWTPIFILLPIVLVGWVIIFSNHSELDIMTFGEEEAQSIGVNLKKSKVLLLIISAAITGSVIAFVGVIGFVDLVVPHISRRIYGSNHRHTLFFSIFLGGSFMVVCDIIARTVATPSELPVGAVTALIGAPFFAHIFCKRKK
ncbi:MAG: FecCD family ABC transporter permease [Lachnospirales bacterium]